MRAQEDTEEEPETPRGNRSPTRAAAASAPGTALSRAFSSGLALGRAASLEQPGTPTTSLRGLNTSGEHVNGGHRPERSHPVWDQGYRCSMPVSTRLRYVIWSCTAGTVAAPAVNSTEADSCR